MAACAGQAIVNPKPTPSPQATATAEPQATAVELGQPRPEVERILEHIRVLSEEIGSRVAGSPEQDEAVAYAQGQLEQWGFNVEIQDFTAEGPLPLRYTTLTVAGRDLDAVAFSGSGSGEVRGPLVDAGTGQEADFPVEAEGAVVLIQRQDVFFVDMARRAQAAGAVAAIVVNNEPGFFVGGLEPAIDLPMVGIDQADGESLRELLVAGPVEVALNVSAEVAAKNVIARPESGICRTLSVAHYDSVPWANGATDNASGSAVVLELARASAAAGLSGSCFVLFGAEEEGLVGSAFFVSQLDQDERDELDAVYNYDSVGGTSGVQLIGEAALAEAADALADEVGIEAAPSRLPENSGSDHLSFLDAGLPALMLTASGGVPIHTPEDTFANLVTDSLGPVVDLGFALLQVAA